MVVCGPGMGLWVKEMVRSGRAETRPCHSLIWILGTQGAGPDLDTGPMGTDPDLDSGHTGAGPDLSGGHRGASPDLMVAHGCQP